ncbi:Hypothetical protein, putative [Bodo saltans]|uniref:Membrane-associated protein n=1 Tax=Bodo saltans TaxID=75058 RepID=A0A0S4JLP2_BODSA|nr:Hypothetical protein, putative [Bodo saltans]|eukprot:CUG89397.1 Hypothetical protein, putative [Bodo saltans]
MKALFCTTCMTIGTVALSTSSIFLLNKGNFSGVTGLVFSGSADSSNDWFGIMGNTFDVDTAVNSSFSGNYMSIFGNNYRSVWSQSSSTCFAMCNYVDDIMMAQSPASGCWGSDCTIGTLCAGSSNGKSQCYYPMANLVCNALQPSCACTNAAASTDFCIPFVAPSCGALVVEFLAPGETPAVAAATWCLLAITILSTVKSGLDVVMMAIAMPQRLVKAANVVKAIPPIPPKPTPPPQTMLLEDDVLPSKGTAIVFNDDTDATPSNSEYDLDPEGDFEILKMRAAAAAALQEQNSLDFVDLGRTNLLMIDVPNTPTRVETDDLAHYYNGAGVTHAQVQSQGLLTGVGREEIDWGITLHQSEFAGGDTSPQSLVTDNNISTFSRNDEGSDTTIEKDGAVDDDMKANVSNDATRFHRFGGEHRV